MVFDCLCPQFCYLSKRLQNPHVKHLQIYVELDDDVVSYRIFFRSA